MNIISVDTSDPVVPLPLAVTISLSTLPTVTGGMRRRTSSGFTPSVGGEGAEVCVCVGGGAEIIALHAGSKVETSNLTMT